MTHAEIVKALHEECKTCSENSICENGVNLAGLYCANKDAADLIERLEKEKADSQWIPVTERLPENDSRVLAYCKDRMIHDMKWSWVQNEWCDKVSGGRYFEDFVTHWVPRPKVPEVK